MLKLVNKRKALTIASLSLSVFLLVFCVLPQNAFAGDFVHNHGGGCYSTVSATCSSHHLRYEYKTNYYHCQRCLIHQTFNETVIWDVCENGLQRDIDCGYVQTCSVCGYVRCNDNPTADAHQYTTTAISCGYGSGERLASVSLSPTSTGWTNGPVTLAASVSVANSRFSLAGSPYNFGSGYSGSSTCEVSENGSYSVTVMASDGSTSSASTTVSNIDKTNPSLSLSKSTEAWTEEGLFINANGSDAESGVAGYSFNGGGYGTDTSYKVTQNGTYSVSVMDNAGNVTTESICISNIGRDPEVIKAEKEAAEKAAAEKAAAEKAAAEKAAAEKAAAEKAAAEKAAAEKAAAEKAAAEKAAAEKAAAGKAAAEKAAGANAGTNTGANAGTNSGSSTGTSAGKNGSGSSATGTTSGGTTSSKKQSGSTSDKTGSSALTGTTGLTGAAGSGVTTNKTGTLLDKIGLNGNKTDSDSNSNNDKNDVSGNGIIVKGGSAGSINGLVSVKDGNTTETDLNNVENTDDTYNDTNFEPGTIMAGEEIAINELEGKKGFYALSDEERAMWYVKIGSVLLIIAILWFSTFSYVYVIEKGKIKPVSIVNVKKEDGKLILHISEKKLSKHGKYMIFYSPWIRLSKKDKEVYVMLKERENVLNTDNGISFAY